MNNGQCKNNNKKKRKKKTLLVEKNALLECSIRSEAQARVVELLNIITCPWASKWSKLISPFVLFLEENICCGVFIKKASMRHF